MEPAKSGREDVRRWIRANTERARRSLVEETRTLSVIERGPIDLSVTRRGVGPIHIDGTGRFFFFDFLVNDEWSKYSVLFRGDLDGQFQPVLADRDEISLRIDSGCETGQVFRDRTCECGPQMHEALRRFIERGSGLLISIPGQDGRGLGLPFKLATMTLQAELGFDTLEASAVLEPVKERDRRTYAGAVAILRFLGVQPGMTLRLMSNNPHKHQVLADNGYSVEVEEIAAGVTEFNRLHLESKRRHMAHTIQLEDDLGIRDVRRAETDDEGMMKGW